MKSRGRVPNRRIEPAPAEKRASVHPLDNLNLDGWDKVEYMQERVVVIDPDVMSGTPCFRGTRVPFKNLIDYLEGGHSLSEFLRQFPGVTHEMAIRALEEAKESLFTAIS